MLIDPYPIITVETPLLWEKWLEKNHSIEAGVWMKFAKKNSPFKTISYSEALDIALCYGWIDSQVKKFDENFYLQKFTPRRSKSIWSKVNTERIEQLIQSGRMKAAGLKQVEEAKKDGRWIAAYDSPGKAEIPSDFLTLLDKNKKAKTFFDTLNKTNVYAITWRIQTAKKPETKEKRMQQIIEMLSKGEKFH